MNLCRCGGGGVVAIVLGSAIALASAGAFTQDGGDAARQDPASRGEPQRQDGGGMPDLVAGLRATPGCLGVDAGQFSSGKQSIFAWFESKQAVIDWYNSDMHRSTMRNLSPMLGGGSPLKHVPDDAGPILVIASLTMSDRPHFDDFPTLPISQISIELFSPLPGGAHLGGRLSPDTFEVPHMSDLTPPATGDGGG
jgi:hypothetical protein